MDFINIILKDLKLSGLLRKITIIQKIKYPYIYIDNQKYLLFCSNDYLGLMCNEELKKAAIKAINKYGTGAGASRLVSGSYKLHEELEKKVAIFKGTEKALVFPSGYQTNIRVISALMNRGDLIIIDKYNHASIIDGAKLSGADIRVYPHKNIKYLEKILKSSSLYKKKLIITDSIFSMDGDIAPLKEIVKLSKKYKAALMVDEAHAMGVFGENGAGLAEELNLHNNIDIQMGTFSKALGGQGGYVAGSKELIDFIINKARGFIYSTAISLPVTASNLEAINVVKKDKKLRAKLRKNVKYFKQKLNEMKINYLGSNSQIFPIIIGDEIKTVKAANYLYAYKIFAPGIRYPTVPKGCGRIRISITAFHRKKDIDYLTGILKKAKNNNYI